MSTNVLAERDANVPPQTTASAKEQPKTMEYHRQILESKLKEDKCDIRSLTHPVARGTNKCHPRSQQTFVSPSDSIMSPASQKLAAFKSKHIAKKYVVSPQRSSSQ
jgi:hypothetical protein